MVLSSLHAHHILDMSLKNKNLYFYAAIFFIRLYCSSGNKRFFLSADLKDSYNENKTTMIDTLIVAVNFML